MTKQKLPSYCPCGSQLDYKDCCGRFHDSEAVEAGAPPLMKSRYKAFVQKRADYLLSTWHETTRPKELTLDDTIKWLGLEIVSFDDGEQEAFVEFIARGKISGRAFKQVEKSRFVKEDGRWFYVDGDVK